MAKKTTPQIDDDNPDDSPIVQRLEQVASGMFKPKGFVSTARLPRCMVGAHAVHNTGSMGGVPFTLRSSHYRMH